MRLLEILAELRQRQPLTLTLHCAEAPRKGIEGSLNDTLLLEVVHELEEDLAWLGRLHADQVRNRGALRNGQVRAVEDSLGRRLCQTIGILARIDGECGSLPLVQNVGQVGGGRLGIVRAALKHGAREATAAATYATETRLIGGLKGDQGNRSGDVLAGHGLESIDAIDLCGKRANGVLGKVEALLEFGDLRVSGVVGHEGRYVCF